METDIKTASSQISNIDKIKSSSPIQEKNENLEENQTFGNEDCSRDQFEINDKSLKHKSKSDDLEKPCLKPEHKQDANQNQIISKINKTNYSGLSNKVFQRTNEKLELTVTSTLYRKLHEKSKKEGVTIDELASELLAEGLVLRAWEIMERKITMKSNSNSNSSSRNIRQNYRNHNHNSNRYRPNNNTQFQGKSKNNPTQGQRRHKYGNQDIDDNANFIEYVRSQEKKNSW